MANHWDIADRGLERMMNAFAGTFQDGVVLTMKLFTNDFAPQPGTQIEDFVEADFPGYEPTVVTGGSWQPAEVAIHVATSVYDAFIVFEADATGFSSQTVFGYWVVDEDGDLIWSESFTTAQTVLPTGTIRVQLKMKLITTPNPV